MQVNVEIDKQAGFCFGVINAVKIAEEALEKYECIYCLGEIVHNRMETERLEKKGMVTVDFQTFRNLKNVRVLIRAHGEPPETYRIAQENHIELIDATCPIVSHLQKKIRTCYDEISDENGQIVIFGKPDHAEVVGLKGQAGNHAVVINSLADIEKIDFSRPVYLYAQTTRSLEEYQKIRTEIEKRLNRKDDNRHIRVISHDTICHHVSGREKGLEQFAGNHDFMVFVSGKNSSNGKQLFEVCRSGNPASIMVSHPEEVPLPLPGDPVNIGISGATSTPLWLMKNIADKIRQFYTH
ncbi:MAG: 4-hydroxy-3-methylbut-2-enyl diphosphate reductase [Chlorobi bacterium]|nr:4-hydroxy-3-methylbut-2-enyl diphosphate reductase [Chlorobiota bacterium]